MGKRGAVWVLAASLLVAACTQDSPDRVAPRSPARSPVASEPGENGLCQPFPDRLIDELVAAYNGRDPEALEALVVAPRVEDVVAAAYGDGSTFEDAGEWANAAWAAGDRMRVAGYGAFNPTKNGFQMLVTRASDELDAAGIESVSMALNADTDGCTIVSLESAGPVQAAGDPCAFYDAYADVPGVAAARPRACADGSARFARTGPVVVAGDGGALVWGGSRGGHATYGDVAMDGFVVDPATGRTTRIAPPDLPAFRPQTGAWTGSELLVLGSKASPDHRVLAASYDPRERSWRTIDFPRGEWSGLEGVWTGAELVLWGGPDHSADPRRRGLVYDPSSDTWERTPRAPIAGRWSHAPVWTGSEMVVWGGTNAHTDLADGAAYNPATESWRKIAAAPLSPRQWLPITWTGTEVVAWGGSSYSRNKADGAAYDPVTDSWRELAQAPIEGRHHHSATWTGEEVIVFGGYDYRRAFANGAAYDPAADRWRKIPRAPVKPRFDHGAVWTGAELLVFGGTWEPGHIALGDGAFYDPATDLWRRLIPRP